MINRERAEQIVREYLGGIIEKPVEGCHGLIWLIAAELDAVQQEASKDMAIECQRLQQEINCLRMEPCTLPHCVEAKTKAYRDTLEEAASITEDYFGKGINFVADTIAEKIRALKDKRVIT